MFWFIFWKEHSGYHVERKQDKDGSGESSEKAVAVMRGREGSGSQEGASRVSGGKVVRLRFHSERRTSKISWWVVYLVWEKVRRHRWPMIFFSPWVTERMSCYKHGKSHRRNSFFLSLMRVGGMRNSVLVKQSTQVT